MKPKTHILSIIATCSLVLLAQVPPAASQGLGQITPNYIKGRFDQEQRRILRYEEVLGLSSRQVDKIKTLKLNLEKEMVLMDARIEVIDIDLRSMLGQRRIDMNKFKKLLTEKYDIEKKRVEGQATAFAGLKELLTEQQQEKMRTTQEIFRGPYGRDLVEDE